MKNAQPFVVDCFRGQIAVAHNGNLINAAVLRDELERKGSIFQTTADSEIILHLLAQPSKNGGSPLSVLRRLEGAFSLIIMSEREIIGVRDPFGFRPLVLGQLDGAYILASETCAFDLVHAEFIREVEPGEVVIISEDGIRSEWPFRDRRPGFLHVRVRLFLAAGQHHGRHQRRQGPHRNGPRAGAEDFRSKRTSSCRCRTPETMPRSVSRRS